MSDDADRPSVRPELYDHPLRRRTLLCLERHASLALADVADELAVWGTADSLAEIPAEDVLDIYLALYRTHLPRLERAGLVVYDQDRDLVSLPGYGHDAAVDGRMLVVEDASDRDDDGA